MALTVPGLASCQTSKTKSRERLLILTPTEARFHGARRFEELVAQHGLTQEQWKTDVVQRVGARVFEATGSKALWRFAVLDSDKVNAAAMFGELMIVHGGLFNWVENEHQLAIILGHEAAHITQHLSASGNFAFYRRYAPEQEIEADRIGLEYAAAAGFDPHEAIPLWSRMAAVVSPSESYQASHPAPDDRLARLRVEASRLVLVYETNRRAAGPDAIASRHDGPAGQGRSGATMAAMRRHFLSCRSPTGPIPEDWVERGRMTATIRVNLDGEGNVEEAEVVDTIDPADDTLRGFAFRARDSLLDPRCSPVSFPPDADRAVRSVVIRFQSQPG